MNTIQNNYVIAHAILLDAYVRKSDPVVPPETLASLLEKDDLIWQNNERNLGAGMRAICNCCQKSHQIIRNIYGLNVCSICYLRSRKSSQEEGKL